MFFAWAKLIFKKHPRGGGFHKIRILTSHLFLALKNYPNERLLDVPELYVESKIWSRYSPYLLFSLRYINERDWARCPTILEVAAGYAVDTGSLQRNHDSFLEQLAIRYESIFNGYSRSDYLQWLIRYRVFMDTFDVNQTYTNKVTFAEIGGGLLPVMALLSRNKDTRMYSYDLFEVHQIQSMIQVKLFPDSVIDYRPTNIKSGIHSPIATPHEEYKLFAFWSYTEISEKERLKFTPLLNSAKTILIGTNKYFEGVDNFGHIEGLATSLGKNLAYEEVGKIIGDKCPNYMKSHRLYYLS